MDHRMALKPNTPLRLCNKNGEVFHFVIENEIGRGASCIVYEAARMTDTGNKTQYRIKEFYPYKLDISRDESNVLTPSSKDAEIFSQMQKRFRSDFSRTNQLFYSDTNYASMTNQLDVFDFNGTSYILSAYSSPKTLATYKPKSLKECVTLVKQVAYVLGNIHRQGYLYLDVKPGNVLVVDGYQKQIRLFDFDSLFSVQELTGADKQCCGDVRLYYTKGFAPIELRTSNIKRLGAHTDVYEIGALLYYLLFGHTPAAPDCETDAAYDYSKLQYDDKRCDDRLFRSLDEFFHKSLAVYYADRYQNMQATIEQLQIIEKYADTMIPRLYSTKIIKPKVFYGRENELEKLDRRLANADCHCLWITGMGGVGKSTFIREYLTRSANKYDTRLYVYYKDSLEATLSDDDAVVINTLHQIEEIKSGKRYFDTKIQKLREIVRDTSSVLVIDNYNGEVDDDFLKLINTGLKVILLTRHAPTNQSFPEMKLNAISDKRTLRQIFEYNLGRTITDGEKDSFERIVKCIDGHTLVLELIAKQIANSHITVSSASSLTENHGFASIAPERVSYEKGFKMISDTVGAVIDALFTASSLSAEQRRLMKVSSLLGDDGIDINHFQHIMKLGSKDDLNELIANGWLMITGDIISMHRVIQEAVRRWDWTTEYLNSAERFLSYFYIEIKLESTKNNYPKKLLSHLSDNEMELPEQRESHRLFHRMNAYDNNREKEGLFGQVMWERIRRFDHSPADIKKLSFFLIQSEMILRQCKREPAIQSISIYLELLYVALINILKYREDYYIVTEASQILSHVENNFVLNSASALIYHKNIRNPIAIMELRGKVFDIYMTYGYMDKAKKQLKKAERLAKQISRKDVYALYYDTLSEYYDSRLDGYYDTENFEQEFLLNKLLDAVNQTIHYSKKSLARDDKHLYATGLLTKAIILIRSGRGTEKKITALLNTAKEVIEENTYRYADVRLYLDMAYAWYFGLILNSAIHAERFINKARKLADIIIPTDLQKINVVIMPSANIFYELRCFGKTISLLEEGMRLCSKQPNADAYARKKQELCDHLLEVGVASQQPEVYRLCQKVIELIECENEEVIDPKNRVVIPEDLRNIITNQLT